MCSVFGCESKTKHTDGLCAKHYTRMNRYGDVNYVKRKRGAPLIERFWGFVRMWSLTNPGCFEWAGYLQTDGYGTFYPGDKASSLAHRTSWEIHNGPIPEGLFVLHKCDNPKCVNPDHLFLGSQQENVDDMIRKGRKVYDAAPQGERHGGSKLRTVDVVSIRTSDLPDGVLAKAYGVARTTINRIKSRALWASVA